MDIEETAASRAHMDGVVRRPGIGWRHLGGTVWEHESGTRLHQWGLVRFIDGVHLSANQWPQSKVADFWIRVAGGNRRRGLMLWVVNMLEGHKEACRIADQLKGSV